MPDRVALIMRLESENDELRERVRQLEEELFATGSWFAPVEFGLTSYENKMLAALMSRSECTKNMLMLALYGDKIDVAQDKIVDVFICKIRAKLKPFGILITTHWGHGYYLTPENKAKVDQWAQTKEPDLASA